MKRKLIAGIATLALGALLVPAAFAAVDDNKATTPNNQQFFNQMFDWHKSWLDQSVKNGQLTEDQAKALNQQFDQMKEYTNKYGMGPGMMGNFNGTCPGYSYGMMGNYNGNGFGPGMMGNFGSQSTQ